MSLWPSWGFSLGAAFVLPISAQTGKTSYCFCDCRSTCLNQLSPYTAGTVQMSPSKHEAVPWDGDVSSCITVLGQMWQCPALSTYSGKVLPAGSPWGTIFSPASSSKTKLPPAEMLYPIIFVARGQLGVHQGTQVLSCELLFRWVAPGMHWCFSPGSGLCTSLWQISRGFHEPNSPVVDVPLDGSTTLWCISHSCQFRVICKLLQVHCAHHSDH